MSNLFDSILNMFRPVKLIPAGVYHYQTPADGPDQYRLHLRVGEEGEGLLIINASTILHLNQTATEYAFHLIKDVQPEKVAKEIAGRYQISQEEARNDFVEFKNKILP